MFESLSVSIPIESSVCCLESFFHLLLGNIDSFSSFDFSLPNLLALGIELAYSRKVFSSQRHLVFFVGNFLVNWYDWSGVKWPICPHIFLILGSTKIKYNISTRIVTGTFLEWLSK